MNVSGLEINQYFVRAIELKRVRGKLSVSALAEEPLVPGTIVNGLLKNRQNFTIALAKLLKNFRGGSSHWIISIPVGGVYTTERVFPKLSSENLKEAVEVNVGSELPGNLENLFWGWQEISLSGEGKGILISSIKKTHLEEFLKVFSELRMVPIAVEPRSCSIVRALIQANKDSTSLILDVEGTPLEKSQTPLTSLIISQGALKFAQEKNISSPDEIIGEIKKLLNYYLIEKKEEQITGIILNGTFGSDLKAQLENEFHLEVKTASEIFPTST